MKFDLRRLRQLTRTVAPQRWLLATIALLAATTAPMTVGLVGGDVPLPIVAFVVAFAVGATVRPDTHTAVGVFVVVFWQWLATIDDPTTPWTILVAACLVVFHAMIALMAVTPTTATIETSILTRWLVRTVAVLAVTVGMWVLVTLLDDGDIPGSVVLTLAGFVTALVLIGALRWTVTRSVDAAASDAGSTR